MPSELKTERRGATLLLTISGPGNRNALSPQVYAAGIEALSTCESDPDLRAVVLTGEGSHFSAGGDVRRMANVDSSTGQRSTSISALHEFIEAIRVCPKPVIAAVEGFAAGAGFSLALACDLLVAAADARFVMSYARVGLTPDGGSSWHLARALPRAMALQAMWLAEPLAVALLHSHGLVNRIAETGKALDEALQMAQALAAMAPNAIAGVKELVDGAANRGLHEQLEQERLQFLEALAHSNAGEGLQAFLDKRTPSFR
jgi:enoyl-CoA hydratase/carnithine racemase